MSYNTTNEDIRRIKTEKALRGAIFSLLKNENFKKITVKGICEKAIVSRATFYAHFTDKYDLLKHSITNLWPQNYMSFGAYEQTEIEINHHIYENTLVIKNLITDADHETVAILFDCILFAADHTAESANERYPKNIVFSNFYAGGLLSYLSWQIDNRFPADLPPMNKYLYDMMHELRDWYQREN